MDPKIKGELYSHVSLIGEEFPGKVISHEGFRFDTAGV